MSLLAREIAARLQPTDKERLGSLIASALGGDPTKAVTGLAPRRGTQDGGIDGRFALLPGPAGPRRAGLFVRLARSPLSLDEFYAFDGHLDREGLCAGVIVTYRTLGPDAAAEFARYNAQGNTMFVHWTLEQVIDGDVDPGPIPFVVNPADALRAARHALLSPA